MSVAELSDRDMEKARDWIDSKCKNLTCECCNKRQWSMVDHFVTLSGYDKQENVYASTFLPSIAIVCRNCGNTKLFNAIISDILDKSFLKEQRGLE